MTTQWKAILDEGVIDEFIISVVPVFIGEGIGLIPSLHRDTQLSLHSAQSFSDGVVQLHYDVVTS